MLNVSESFGVVPFRGVRGIVHVVRGKYVIPLLSRPLSLSYHHYYIHRFYTDKLVKLASIGSEEKKDAVKVITKYLCLYKEKFL